MSSNRPSKNRGNASAVILGVALGVVVAAGAVMLEISRAMFTFGEVYGFDGNVASVTDPMPQWFVTVIVAIVLAVVVYVAMRLPWLTVATMTAASVVVGIVLVLTIGVVAPLVAQRLAMLGWLLPVLVSAMLAVVGVASRGTNPRSVDS